MRKYQRMLILLISFLVVVGFLPTTAQAEETAAGKFILVAEAGGKLVIAPEYITYTSEQTLGAALEASGHVFTGLDVGQVTAIDGVTGNYTRSDQNGGYDLTVPASSVTHFCFSERASSDSRPSQGHLLLMTAMADYLEKTDDVRQAAKEAYRTAFSSFAGIGSENAETLAYELNRSVRDYENILNGTHYAVSFTDGSSVYSQENFDGVSVSAVNAYGKQWEDEGDGTMLLPRGKYTFRIHHAGLSVSGKMDLSGDTSITAELPKEKWLKTDTFRLSGSFGADTNEAQTFKDAEFTLGKWKDREVTVPVLDSFVGTVYTYAEYDDTLLSQIPTLSAVYTMQNATEDEMEKNIPFGSLNSGAYSVLARGSKGNTVIYRLSSTGTDGYTYAQDYTVNFARIPTLTSVSLCDQNGTDLAATTAFEGKVTAYTYKVLDTVSAVRVNAVPLMEDYAITVNGQPAAEPVPISGETKITVTVSAHGVSNTYALTVQPGHGKSLSFISDKSVTVEVVNSNGVVMPYTTQIETATKNRYRYTLVPGEQYSYVATNKQHYHIADDFYLDEVANSLITVNFDGMQDWLTELSFGFGGSGPKYKNTLSLDTAFSPEKHDYQVSFVDTEHYPYVWVSSTERANIQAIYNQLFTSASYHGKELRFELYGGKTDGEKLNYFLMDENPLENRLMIRLSKETDGVTYYQDYEIDFKRVLTLKDLSAKCDDTPVVLLQEDGTPGFTAGKKEYSAMVSLAAQTFTLDFSCYTENTCYGEEQVGYRVSVDGVDVTEAKRAFIALDGTLNTQTVSVTVENPKAPQGKTTYLVHILKSPPVETSFAVTPENALVNLRENLSGERLWPNEQGAYQLCEGYSYDYALTQYGFVGRAGTLTVTRNAANQLVIQDGMEQYPVTEQGSGGAATIRWTLSRAAANSSINPEIPSEWPNFRGNNQNNAVTNAPIPASAEEGTLYWANKIGSGTDSNAVGSPILVDGALITYASNVLYRVDTVTGEILATGEMDHKSSFSITPPTYAEGMIFVALSDGCVQAFNADTLESLWIYNDPLGGQPNCPLTVKDGYLYTGFWNSETADARFVCLSITDEQPQKEKEEKCASWFYTAKGGFYWAGAYVGSDFVLVGTDDGGNSYADRTSRLLLLEAKTGKLLDSWDNLHGDIRSSVVFDNVTNAFYFTAKGGTFYSVQVSERKLTNKWNCPLENTMGGTPMSTSSPVVHNGRAYVGVSGAGQFSAYSGHSITVIDLKSRAIAYSVPTQGYPQTSGLLTTAYEAGSGSAYVYFFDNYTPGKLRALRDRPDQTAPDFVTMENGISTAYALFTPTGKHAQYAICSPIVDKYGTVYFKNDSGYLMAFGRTVNSISVNTDNVKTDYIAGETFDSTGMVVTASYANGDSRDVTSYVSYSREELTAKDQTFTISFQHVLYHNEEDGTQMKSGVAVKTPNATITLNIGSGLLGDVNCDGFVDQKDAQMILEYEAQLLNKDLILSISDVSGDGVIDSNDAVLILQNAFPEEENGSQES